jgi:hypothetical protein
LLLNIVSVIQNLAAELHYESKRPDPFDGDSKIRFVVV